MKKLIILLLIINIRPSQGQDIHFSQFYNSPLSLNPAFTGKFNGNIRLAANHRQQWRSITKPYVTSSVSFDTRAFDDRLNGDAIGAGIIIISDKSGTAGLKTLKFAVSGAYHKQLGKSKNHTIIAAVQGGFFQKSIDYSNLNFASQFDETEFDQSINNQEFFLNNKITKGDINAGVLYEYKLKNQSSVYSGISSFHINRANESLTDNYDVLSMRTSFYGGGLIKTRNKKLDIKPDLIYTTQANAHDLVLSGLIEYKLSSIAKDNIKVITGTSFRYKDALILLGGIGYKKWQGVLSYDINISSLSPVSNNRGGFEISLIYIDNFLPGKNNLPVIIPCERL